MKILGGFVAAFTLLYTGALIRVSFFQAPGAT